MKQNLIIVTGSGRCGTSITMEMLDRMGITIHCDPGCRSSSWEDDRAVGGTLDNLTELKHGAIKVLDIREQRVKLEDIKAKVINCIRNPKEQTKSHAKFIGTMMGLHLKGPDTARFLERLTRDNATLPCEIAARGIPILILPFELIITNPEVAAVIIAGFVETNPADAAEIVLPRGVECQPGLDIEIAKMEATA